MLDNVLLTKVIAVLFLLSVLLGTIYGGWITVRGEDRLHWRPVSAIIGGTMGLLMAIATWGMGFVVTGVVWYAVRVINA